MIAGGSRKIWILTPAKLTGPTREPTGTRISRDARTFSKKIGKVKVFWNWNSLFSTWNTERRRLAVTFKRNSVRAGEENTKENRQYESTRWSRAARVSVTSHPLSSNPTWRHISWILGSGLQGWNQFWGVLWYIAIHPESTDRGNELAKNSALQPALPA